MDYTYKGRDYPKVITLNFPKIEGILSKPKDDFTLGETSELLHLPEDGLRQDLENLIMAEIGKQWGKSIDELRDDPTTNPYLVNNCLILLTDVGVEETSLPVVLEILRQSEDFLKYNNIIDFFDYKTLPIVTTLYSLLFVNTWKLQPFLLEEGITTSGKQVALLVLSVSGSVIKQEGVLIEALPQIYQTAKEVLEAYIADADDARICDKQLLSYAVNAVSDLGMCELAETIGNLYSKGLLDEQICDKEAVEFGLHEGGTQYIKPVSKARDLLLPD